LHKFIWGARYVLLFIFSYFLTGEFLKFFMADLSRRRRSLFSAAFSFIILQIFWAIALLPIGFLNSAALLLPVVFLLSDFIIHHLDGSLSRRIVLRNVTILIAAFVIVSLVSKWTL